MPRKLCVHCGTRQANRSWGLCNACYHAPGVQEQYRQDEYHEPTTEEIEALVAQQLPMPGTIGHNTAPPYHRPLVHNPRGRR